MLNNNKRRGYLIGLYAVVVAIAPIAFGGAAYAAETSIKIGVLLPLSGRYASAHFGFGEFGDRDSFGSDTSSGPDVQPGLSGLLRVLPR
jgi:hypothetical protein